MKQAPGPAYPPYLEELYEKSGGARYGFSLAEFARTLEEVSGRYLPPEATQAERAQLHRSLHVEDLALARACALGSERGWEYFLNRYRQKLYETAGAIAREESAARELADSLYTDLFGTRQDSDGRRISKLASYTGRGSLEGWLRTVLAQDYINRYRNQRRLVSFDETASAGQQLETKHETTASPADARLEQSVDEALGALTSHERWLLACWYLDGRTLAEIARMMNVHESTACRRLEKITASLRKRIVRGLRERGMNSRAAEEAMETDVRDLNLDVRRRLLQGSGG